MIKTLGARVEQEHAQHLRDVRRIEQQTNTYSQSHSNGANLGANGGGGGEVDFESLVKGTASPAPASTGTAGLDPWDDGWADSGDLDSSLVSPGSTLTRWNHVADCSNLVKDIPGICKYQFFALCLNTFDAFTQPRIFLYPAVTALSRIALEGPARPAINVQFCHVCQYPIFFVIAPTGAAIDLYASSAHPANLILASPASASLVIVRAATTNTSPCCTAYILVRGRWAKLQYITHARCALSSAITHVLHVSASSTTSPITLSRHAAPATGPIKTATRILHRSDAADGRRETVLADRERQARLG